MALPNENESNESDSQHKLFNGETVSNDMTDDRSMDSPPSFKKKEKEDEMIKLQELFNKKEQEIKSTEEEKKKIQESFDLKEKELKKIEEEKKKLQKLFDLKEKQLKTTEEEKKKLKDFLNILKRLGWSVMVSLLAGVLLYSVWCFTFKGHQLNDHELRLMLVGKTGAGKSASGNTIMGEEMFRVESSPASVTATCERKNKMVDKRNITVIDTPGVMDTWLTSNDTAHHAPDCISMSSPDPHVFLLVIRLGRFTVEERNAVKWIRDNFGEEALKFTMILFTGGDLLEGKPIENFISNSNELQNLVETCGGRYHVFNNYDQRNHTQVTKLLEKIDTIIHENMGYIHTKEIHQEVQQKTREEEEIKRVMMENQFRLEEKIKWKQLKDESISECNVIGSQIRQQEEEKRKQFEENIKAEKSRQLNEMAIKLRDEQYKNTQLTKNLKFWHDLSLLCIVVLFSFVIIGGIVIKIRQ